MPKKFIQRHIKALTEITSKMISVLPFIDDNPDVKAERNTRTMGDDWSAFLLLLPDLLPPRVYTTFMPSPQHHVR